MVSIKIPQSMRLTEKEWDALFLAHQKAVLADRAVGLEEEVNAQTCTLVDANEVEAAYIEAGIVPRADITAIVNEVCSSESREVVQDQCEIGSPDVPLARALPRVYGAVAPPRPEYEGYSVEVPSENWFDSFTRTVKQAILKCCCMGDVVTEWETERKFDHDVNRHMVLQTLPGDKSVEETVVEITHHVNKERVNKVPRLVAQVTVALRMKLGMGAMDASVAGNVSLVRAQAARLMRDWGVRDKDAAAHLADVERCFFNNDVHYRLSNWRSRAIGRSLIARMMFLTNEPPRFDC